MDEAQKRIESRGAASFNFAAIAEVIDLDSRGELVSILRDLSASGCFVKTTTPFASGTWVRIRITHSGADFAAIGNVTANVTATGMGIIFTQMEPNDRAILEKWLENAR
jgi:hypothetical protein